MINPVFKDSNGYTILALAKTDPDNQNLDIGVHVKSVLEDVLKAWGDSSLIKIDGDISFNIMDYYAQIITLLGIDLNEAKSFVEAELIVIEQREYERQSIMGVSMDEEMKNMLVYQHAYNASARILNVIDSMIDRIVNRVGRAGL
jgi:flagellar hook-associated protein 1 FlgK